MDYRVVWEIDIDSKSAKQAALAALAIQRDRGSEATFFEVTAKKRKPQKTVAVDLEKYVERE
jgi:hypothetical protein